MYVKSFKQLAFQGGGVVPGGQGKVQMMLVVAMVCKEEGRDVAKRERGNKKGSILENAVEHKSASSK